MKKISDHSAYIFLIVLMMVGAQRVEIIENISCREKIVSISKFSNSVGED